MVLKSKTEVDDLVQEHEETFRVHSRVYTDPAIFELEMEHIFEKVWVYVGHESEIPEGGNYKTAMVGRQPVIITRNSDDGKVYGLINACRHRGSNVCHEAYGTANYFRCSYHGWVYDNRGGLVGVPGQEAYGDSFNIREMGLDHVPRLAIYRGFIFVSFDPEGPTLEEHLGNAKPYIDTFAGMGPEGIELKAGAHKFGYDANWKWQLDNTVDGYHAQFTHRSYFDIVGRRIGHPLSMSRTQDLGVWDLGNGHGVLDMMQGGVQAQDGRPGPMTTPGFNISIFPNLALLFSQVRHIIPVAVNRTLVQQLPVRLKGVANEFNTQRLREHEDFYGPGGFAAPDDWEMYGRCQKGLANGDRWVNLSRGLKYEKTDELGRRGTHQDDESSQRAIYRHWKRLMASVLT